MAMAMATVVVADDAAAMQRDVKLHFIRLTIKSNYVPIFIFFSFWLRKIFILFMWVVRVHIRVNGFTSHIRALHYCIQRTTHCIIEKLSKMKTYEFYKTDETETCGRKMPPRNARCFDVRRPPTEVRIHTPITRKYGMFFIGSSKEFSFRSNMRQLDEQWTPAHTGSINSRIQKFCTLLSVNELTKPSRLSPIHFFFFQTVRRKFSQKKFSLFFVLRNSGSVIEILSVSELSFSVSKAPSSLRTNAFELRLLIFAFENS